MGKADQNSGRWAIFRYVIIPLLCFGVIIALSLALLKEFPWVALTVIAVLAGIGRTRYLRKRRTDLQRGWRTGHIGRDQIYYDEHIDGKWARVMIGGEMLDKKPHHVIYFRMIKFPDWAKGREDQIVQRIKSAFPPPDYEYHED